MVLHAVHFFDCVSDSAGIAGDRCARDSPCRGRRRPDPHARGNAALAGLSRSHAGCGAGGWCLVGGLSDRAAGRNRFDEGLGRRFRHGWLLACRGATPARVCGRRCWLCPGNRLGAPAGRKDVRCSTGADPAGLFRGDWARCGCDAARQRHSAAPRFAHGAGANPARGMMTELRDTNRAMFWRILRRLLGANRGRLFVMLLALGAGAAVTAALLNLQVDAKRRLTTEFRAFGPNVLILPKGSSASGSETLAESVIHSVPVNVPSGRVTVMSYLYIVANISAAQSGKSVTAVVAGANPFGIVRVTALSSATPATSPNGPAPSPERVCVAGTRFAQQVG